MMKFRKNQNTEKQIPKEKKLRVYKVNPRKKVVICLLYTSDAADEEDSVDLGGLPLNKKKKIKKKNKQCRESTSRVNMR